MAERPIIFSAESVKAILEDRKSQTRRVIKPQPPDDGKPLALYNGYPGVTPSGVANHVIGCPFGTVGDRLWVRETWGYTAKWPASLAKQQKAPPAYKADAPDGGHTWFSPLFMPRWASRLTLELTAVRVERLQDITLKDALAEGYPDAKHWQSYDWSGDGSYIANAPISYYQNLWQQLNGKKPGFAWQDNPFVFVLEFKRVEP